MLSKKSKIYAQSLLELDSSPEFLQSLQSLTSTFQDPKIKAFFKAPNIPVKDKKALLQKNLAKAPKILKNFFYLLLDHKSFALLPEISQHYQELFDEKQGICRALVFSPKKLEPEQKAQLVQTLEKFFNKKIAITEKEDKSLIAGLSIQAGGYLLNGNYLQQLQSFERLGGL